MTLFLIYRDGDLLGYRSKEERALKRIEELKKEDREKDPPEEHHYQVKKGRATSLR